MPMSRDRKNAYKREQRARKAAEEGRVPSRALQVEDGYSYKILPTMGDWSDQAACKGATDIMFPGQGEDVRPAKRICRGCPVKQPCLEYALDAGERFGVWAATTELERRALRKHRQVVA